MVYLIDTGAAKIVKSVVRHERAIANSVITGDIFIFSSQVTV
jgi:hypothetical protein